MRATVTRRAIGLVLALGVPGVARAQSALRSAEQAYAALDYNRAIAEARRALALRLERGERVRAYELLAYTYGALDSSRQAVDAFKEMIFLDPDREPDRVRVSPRLTSLYDGALGQVLVVRRVRVDSASFVAGQGVAPVRFQVTRAARVVVRAVGQNLDLRLDSLPNVAGELRVDWRAVSGADAVPPGRYQLLIDAGAGREQFTGQALVEVIHSPVDTVNHLTVLAGYNYLPESEQPPKSFRPLGIAALFTGVAAGASLALRNTQVGASTSEELGGVSTAALLVGLLVSLKKADPRPVPAAIQYNQLLRDQLARRNAEIAADNVQRRRMVRLTIRPVTP